MMKDRERESNMTPRERFVAALEHKPPTGRAPHFELVFFLTMDVFGKVHPGHRDYSQWDQMQEKERRLHANDLADLYIAIAERFEHSAILVHTRPMRDDIRMRVVQAIREKAGDKYFLMVLNDPTFEIPPGDRLTEFCMQLADEPDKVKAEARASVDQSLKRAEWFQRQGGLDGFAMCCDYCFNTGPFLSPAQFGEFVTPYLARAVQGYRDMGFYAIKHTDGNIRPILDQLVQANPHALHSLDPQGGVDIAEVKRQYGDRICLMGNVNCGLLDTGTDEECIEAARYALRNGMPGGGYVFATSNCVYTGMRLERYELILDVWRKEGNY